MNTRISNRPGFASVTYPLDATQAFTPKYFAYTPLTMRKPWNTRPDSDAYDVVIVGGAMYGSAVAWFLTDNLDFSGRILVVERDPTYSMCSTAHTNSCMRQQFSNEINIRISQFAAQYVKNFRKFMGGDSRVPDLTLQSFGYLYLADNEAFAATLRTNQKLQAECGAATRMLDPDEIHAAYPFFALDDIIAGSHNPVDEGYFDGGTLFEWWRRSASEQGVEFLANEVVAMDMNADSTAVQKAVLKTGEHIACDVLVNASGPRAVETSRMAGIDVPVEPRKRYTFVFDAARPLDRDMPLTIDPTGVHMRCDGRYYLAGCAPDPDHAVDYDDFEPDQSIWDDWLWPIIARRIPQFDALKIINSWVGHYAYNTLDQNAIVGPHTRVKNFMFVNGFSGHGLQQSPALGRGLAEWITWGEYRSLDLTPFGYTRIERGEPFSEKAVI